jgi:hypothetical protein
MKTRLSSCFRFSSSAATALAELRLCARRRSAPLRGSSNIVTLRCDAREDQAAYTVIGAASRAAGKQNSHHAEKAEFNQLIGVHVGSAHEPANTNV